MNQKTLNNSDVHGAIKQVSDLEVFGDGDIWQLISKASSQTEGWMKSTKAMHIENVGCCVQVTTQQRNSDGSYAIAEALTFVPGTRIITVFEIGGAVKSRCLINDYSDVRKLEPDTNH